MEKKINEIIRKIEMSENILIFAHIRADLDALGSSWGLFELLTGTYPEKNIKIFVEDGNYNFPASDEDLRGVDKNNALKIVLDTSVVDRVYNPIEATFDNANCIIIDHHPNQKDEFTAAIKYVDTTAGATAQIITELSQAAGWSISSEAADYLYWGLAGDTGSFRYCHTPAVFNVAGVLSTNGADINRINDILNSRTLSQAQMTAYTIDISRQLKGKNGSSVLYFIFDKENYKELGLDINQLAGANVRALEGIVGYPLWASAVWSAKDSKYLVELRGKNGYDVSVVARNFGGGGHVCASGACVDTIEEVNLIMEALQALLD